ncbi:hypothetical protein GQX74_004011 [Glossina fuscipes]|nr:hypothetical protein GQX74_004011 [Glossina fuscipes]
MKMKYRKMCTLSVNLQVVNSSSSTTTRVEKKSRLHQITSSSSSSSSSSTSTEMKAAALKRDMSEFKNSMSEINDLALGRGNTGTPALTSSTSTLSHHQPPSINDLSNLNNLNSSDAITKLKKKIRSSLENIVDDDIQPKIKFPDDDDEEMNMDLVEASNQLSGNGLNGTNVTVDTVKFEEKRTKTESKKKFVTDGFSSEQATSNLAESKRLQAGDIDFQQATAAAATRNRLEVDGVKAEENAAVIHCSQVLIKKCPSIQLTSARCYTPTKRSRYKYRKVFDKIKVMSTVNFKRYAYYERDRLLRLGS